MSDEYIKSIEKFVSEGNVIKGSPTRVIGSGAINSLNRGGVMNVCS